MTDKLHCPFCQQELIREGMNHWWCSCNIEHQGKELYGTTALWQALIKAKQDLEIIRKALEVARNLYQELALAYCEMADDYRTTYGCLKTPEQETQEYMQEYDEKITSITKQEK